MYCPPQVLSMPLDSKVVGISHTQHVSDCHPPRPCCELNRASQNVSPCSWGTDTAGTSTVDEVGVGEDSRLSHGDELVIIGQPPPVGPLPAEQEPVEDLEVPQASRLWVGSMEKGFTDLGGDGQALHLARHGLGHS